MLRIAFIKINSFLSYIFPVLEFLYLFGDRRVSCEQFLMKKYWYTKNHLITWCLLLNGVQLALSPKRGSATDFLLAWLLIKHRRMLEVSSWLILMGHFTKFGLLKGRCENSQMLKMWDKNLQDIENPESLS